MKRRKRRRSPWRERVTQDSFITDAFLLFADLLKYHDARNQREYERTRELLVKLGIHVSIQNRENLPTTPTISTTRSQSL